MYNILVCDDDKEIVKAIEIYLAKEGYNVFKAYDGNECLEILQKNKVQLVILDIMMPKKDGIETINEIREKYSIPVIMLSAKSEDEDKIKGLDMGADDYVTKPFRIRELISRINRILSRYEKNQIKSNILKYQDIEINIDKCKVTKNNKEIIFTSLEYKILLLLFGNVGNLITRDQLLDKIWDIAGNFVNDNTLTVYIKRIREKLEDKDGKIIQTIRGIGYRVGN